MQEFLSSIDFGAYNWIRSVFLVVLATVIVNFILRRLSKSLSNRFLLTENLWDDAVLQAMTKPALLFIWVIGLSFAAEIVKGVSANEILNYTSIARRIAIILLLMMFLTRLVKNVEVSALQKKAQKKTDTDEVTVRVVARLLRLAIMITSALVILQTLDISVSGVVAFGGIGGIAIGFAAKDLLANFFGGLMIYLDRPFTVGDWIRSPDREIEGTVEEIGWRLTCIRTFDKRPLYIPNAMFASISVENPSRMLNRRIKETFGLRCSDANKVREIIAAVKKMLQEHKEIDTDNTLIVNLNNLSPSSLDFFIYTFTKTTDWIFFHEIKQDVLLKVIDIIHAHGADIAFPTITVDGLDSKAAVKTTKAKK